MIHSQGLLLGMMALLRDYVLKSGLIFTYSLLGLNLGGIKANAENNILVIHSYDSELSSTKQHQEGIERGFAEIGTERNVYHEYLDSEQYLQATQEKEFVEYINKKYRRLKIDLLMVVEEPTLELVLRQHQKLFPELDVPVVFVGIDELSQEMLDTPWLTGVVEDHSIAETAVEATRQTWSNTVVIINDTTEAGQANLEQIAAVKENPYKSLKVDVINDLTLNNIKTKLSKYPESVPIVMLGQLYQDRAKDIAIDPGLDVKLLRKSIPNPIYTNSSVRLGNGVVGGKIFDVEYHIRQGVELADKILQGANPDEVGPFSTSKNRWIFDYRELLRYDIKLERLPEDSQLVYVEAPIYVKYRTPIFAIGFILLSSFSVIILLLGMGRKRELANKILQENEQRYKDLAQAGANVFWEL
ncbi:MAG: GGDEF-domain containing protein, partial [Cyanobacteria bacterium J06631_2]